MTDAVDRVLWTAGWDSTFRVAQLLLGSKARVEPWYVIDDDRRSSPVELRTMESMRAALIERDETVRQRLLPTRIVRKADIPSDSTITSWYQGLRKSNYWGAQYEWLARLAKAENVRFQIGLKSDDSPTARLSRLIVPVEGSGRFVLDPALEDGPEQLFKYFEFPICDLSKTQLVRKAETEGFDDILSMAWSCHTPLFDGKPCGWCNPCKHAREEGFGHRVPPPTLGRRVQYQLITMPRRLRRRLSSTR